MGKTLDEAKLKSLADKIRDDEDSPRKLSAREKEEAKIKRSKKPVSKK